MKSGPFCFAIGEMIAKQNYRRSAIRRGAPANRKNPCATGRGAGDPPGHIWRLHRLPISDIAVDHAIPFARSVPGAVFPVGNTPLGRPALLRENARLNTNMAIPVKVIFQS